MATKDITDLQICQVVSYRELSLATTPDIDLIRMLMDRSGQCEKVCYCALYRAVDRDLITYGVSVRCSWLTPEGKTLLDENANKENQ